MKIYYLAPDSNKPSWGLGVIYHHVNCLFRNGFDAYILHEKSGFKLSWLNLKVPIDYQDKKPIFSEDDILVVPEVMVNLKGLKKIKCRKIFFVQASAFLFESLPYEETHLSLGFTNAIGIMPHMIPIIEKFTSLPTYLIPPFIADYFYQDSRNLDNRKKTILIYPKFNQQDYGILKRLITDKIKVSNSKKISSLFIKGWQLVEVKDKSHKEVAGLMKEAAFFISTNSFEAFNTSVPEAMAAGCINLCYEGVGPKDYLKNNENAFVFGNNEVYALCSQLFLLIDNYENEQYNLQRIRENAVKTASQYRLENMEREILEFYNNLSKGVN